MKLRRVLVLARTEVLHVVRDRATMAQVLIVPIVQLLVLSNAATFQIRDTPTYIVDLDRSSASRGLVTRLAASGHFRLAGDRSSLAAADGAMLSGEATLVVTDMPDRISSHQSRRPRSASGKWKPTTVRPSGTASGTTLRCMSQSSSLGSRSRSPSSPTQRTPQAPTASITGRSSSPARVSR